MSRKILPSMALAAGAAALLSVGAGALHAQTSVPMDAAENGRLWFVELAGDPESDGGSRAAVEAEQATFRGAAAAAGVRFTERRAYGKLFNGFALMVEPQQRARLAQLPGFKAMYPVETIPAPAPEVASGSVADLAAAVGLTRANVAQNTLGLSGQGVKVGIIDSGIDIDHPAFGGSGVPGTTAFPSARVAYGYDFVGDAYNAAGSGAALVPVPDPNPDDNCNGHGTHVAGIVGANGGGIKGVAPKVTFGVYRVFGCTGSTSSDIILAAMEMAHDDGMDVVNQSLGASRQWPQYPTARAASRLVNKGIVMVASIGNTGPGGSPADAQFAAGAPGVGKNVIGVASYDNAQLAFTVNGTPYGYSPVTASPLPPLAGSLPMAKTGTPASLVDACAALPAGSLGGMAVLIRRGTCSFYIKASNAQNAGAAAVVLYNNVAGALNSATVAPPVGMPAVTVPVVGITAAQGATLDAAIAAGPTTLTWGSDYVSYPFGTGGLISSFSSFGLAADLSLKPDLGAPGGGIFSSFPLELGGAASLSGTSMSSPHVAGAVALILEARPNIAANTMAARLQNSAQPKFWSGNPALGLLDHVHRQGAGMIDIVATVQSKTLVTPSEISLGESVNSNVNPISIRVENNTAKWADWTVSHVSAVAAGPNTQSGASYNLTGVFDAPATVTIGDPNLRIAPRGTGWVIVTITANPALPERSIYGGYFRFTPADGGPIISVPYAGLKGDYQSTQVLTPTANGFPWLAQLVGTSFFNRPAGGTFTMVGDDIPFFLVHLDHLSRRLKFEAFDAITGQPWNKVSDDEYVTRSSAPGSFFTFPWDGTTFKGKGTNPNQFRTVPNGQYVVKVSVLKALGDEDDPAHTETWVSPVITIARP